MNCREINSFSITGTSGEWRGGLPIFIFHKSYAMRYHRPWFFNRFFSLLYRPGLLLPALLFSLGVFAQQGDPLPRSNPESEGVSSAAVLSFVEAAEKSRNEFHSFMLLRHGKVVAEGWWNPYQPGLKHTLYSVSKSFMSTAVGFAVNEGLLSVNDKVVSFFPNDLPAVVSPYLAGLTVKDLLCMLEGQDPDPTTTIANGDSTWVKGFLATPFVNKPGEHFLYNTMGVYMLAAIVEKKTGQHLIDYLKPRLFKPLGIEDEDWEDSPQGIDVGGWGLRLRTEGMAKMGQLYLQHGKWDGKQVLPAEWVADATASYNSEGPVWARNMPTDSSDWKQGYGYLFWRCRHHAFRADGAYGQLIVVMPDEDAVLAVTCETHDMQDEVNLIWDHLLPAMHKGTLPVDAPAAAALQQKLSALALPLPSGRMTDALEDSLSGKTFSMGGNDLAIEWMRFDFDRGVCHIDLNLGDKVYHLRFGAGKWIGGETELPGPNMAIQQVPMLAPLQVAGSYVWKDDHTLELVLRYIESPHTEIFHCHFDGNKLSASLERSMDFGSKKTLLEGKVK